MNAIYVSSCLSDQLQNSPIPRWRKVEHILDSILKNYPKFKSFYQEGSILGFAPKRITQYYKWFTNYPSINQHDRIQICTNQIRVILNMVRSDFKNIIPARLCDNKELFNKLDIDIFSPIE